MFKNPHAFVAVSFSNATSCDVCTKPLFNKPALQCQSTSTHTHTTSRHYVNSALHPSGVA